MKTYRLHALAVVVCMALFAAAADTPTTNGLTKEDRKTAINYLKDTKKEFLKSVKGLSDEQWNYKPAPDRWSVGEVAEHIALSEDFISARIGDVMKAPEAPADKRAATKGKEEQILKAIPDRSRKAQAPEPLLPKHKFATRDALLKAFSSKRDENIKYIKDTKEDMRAHIAPSPLGEIDAYQWMLFMAAHSKRHTAQIEEVKADANFPKKK